MFTKLHMTMLGIIIIIIIIIIMSVYEEGDVTVLWNQAVHTDREVTANRPDIIIIIIIIKLRGEMSQCCGIKQYTQTEKLQQTGQI